MDVYTKIQGLFAAIFLGLVHLGFVVLVATFIWLQVTMSDPWSIIDFFKHLYTSSLFVPNGVMWVLWCLVFGGLLVWVWGWYRIWIRSGIETRAKLLTSAAVCILTVIPVSYIQPMSMIFSGPRDFFYDTRACAIVLYVLPALLSLVYFVWSQYAVWFKRRQYSAMRLYKFVGAGLMFLVVVWLVSNPLGEYIRAQNVENCNDTPINSTLEPSFPTT